MLAKDLIKILEKNPESEITLSIQTDVDSRQGFCNHIDDVTNSGKTITIVGVMDEPHLFEEITKDKLIKFIKRNEFQPMSDEYMYEDMAKGMIQDMYKEEN